MSQPSVLFICTANVCRSPMAMGLLRKKASEINTIWRIESAGVMATDGLPVSINTRIVLETRNIQIQDHKSRIVTQAILDKFNLVLVMEKNHKEAIQAAFPEHRKKVFLMSEMIGESYEIVDPIGKSKQDYEDTAREMEKILDNGFSKIKRLAKKAAD